MFSAQTQWGKVTSSGNTAMATRSRVADSQFSACPQQLFPLESPIPLQCTFPASKMTLSGKDEPDFSNGWDDSLRVQESSPTSTVLQVLKGWQRIDVWERGLAEISVLRILPCSSIQNTRVGPLLSLSFSLLALTRTWWCQVCSISSLVLSVPSLWNPCSYYVEGKV